MVGLVAICTTSALSLLVRCGLLRTHGSLASQRRHAMKDKLNPAEEVTIGAIQGCLLSAHPR
jgi:hypothetical protein